MKIAEVLDPAFQASFLKLMNCDLEISVAQRLKKLNGNLMNALRNFEQDRQQALAVLGSKDQAGNLLVDEDGAIKLEDGAAEAFTARVNAALDVEVAIDTFSIQELAGTKLSANDLVAIAPLLNL